ncbi:STM4015 family protein [Streptomyces sp. NPDC093085]|uniref:STM4015 family protein n=1 Tax=Streptomyces sp. NPDC093085 TaxID=3155068 RepID=UPI003442AF1F
MSYVRHVEQFHGLPAFTYSPYIEPGDLPDPGSVAWRLRCPEEPYESDYAGRVEEYWARFVASVELERVRALIFGAPWWGPGGGLPDEALFAVGPRLTALEALFLSDLEDDEAMISTIFLGDLAPYLEAFPALRELAVRGGEGLRFPAAGHGALRALRVESGGLPPEAARQIAAAELPSLERLELWLGDEEYGGGTTPGDLAPLLRGEGKPALRHLGIQNSPDQDAFAAALAAAPVVARLDSLSLSMGALTDTGAAALLDGRPLAHLRELDLSHHFLSHAMMVRLWTELEPAGVRVELGARREPEEYGEGEDVPEWDDEPGRYIAVAE